MYFARVVRCVRACRDVVVSAPFAAGLHHGAGFDRNAGLHDSCNWTSGRRAACALFFDYYCLHLLVLGHSTGPAPISGPRWVRSGMRVLDEERRSPVRTGDIFGDAGLLGVAAQGHPPAPWLVLHRTSASVGNQSVLQDLVRSAER